MNSTNSAPTDTTPDVSPYSSGHHTAQAIAQAHNVSSSTIRNRWYPWLKKVAPEALLKDGKAYTDLARELFTEFAEVATPGRDAWVAEAIARYSHEWSSVGVIDAELMPDGIGEVLAVRQAQTGAIHQSMEAEMLELEKFADQLLITEGDLSQTALNAYTAMGAQRGMLRFKVETQAELEAYSRLMNRRMGGQSGV